MQWKKKFCIRITARRIVAAILIAASSVNLIIVGAAFEVASPSTPTPTSLSATNTLPAIFSVQTATLWDTITPISSPTETFTPTSSPTITSTPSATLTSTPTSTPTSTYTSPPPPTQCVLKSYWYPYYVQSGDTLYSLALLTGSTVDELMLANCLSGTLIFRGQILYLPRLPIVTDTPTPKINYPPVVTITNPAPDSKYDPVDFDEKLGWYITVVLQGGALDPEDGVLQGSSLIWTSDRPDIHGHLTLGRGTEVAATLYANDCNGTSYTITLAAIDKEGNLATAARKIFISARCPDYPSVPGYYVP
jgi:LysM repeat protein